MKPILINGYPRSGTSYIYLKLLEHFPDKVLYEPLNPNTPVYAELVSLSEVFPVSLSEHIPVHPYFSEEELKKFFEPYLKIFGPEKLEKLCEEHPSPTHYAFYYDEKALIKYLENFKGFHIKEVSLHFYVDNKFIQRNWDVYHIIRHPADVYLSIIKRTGIYKRKLYKLVDLPIIGRLFREAFEDEISEIADAAFDLYVRAIDVGRRYNKPEVASIVTRIVSSFKGLFVFTWTITNWYAINHLPKNKILIYGDNESMKNLPVDIKWEKYVTYPQSIRRKITGDLIEIAGKLGIGKQFIKLLNLF